MYSRNVNGKQRQWRQVPRSAKELGRILEACHSSAEG